MIEKNEFNRAWAQIHLDRLKRNIEKCRSLLKPPCELMCVVKANCYGHGAGSVIPYMEDSCGVDWFAVSNLIEAIELRDLGVSGEILILGYTPPECAPELIKYDIIQTVTEYDYAVMLSKSCPIKERVRVHIAVDTGMTRIGIRAHGTQANGAHAQKANAHGVLAHNAYRDRAHSHGAQCSEEVNELCAQISRIAELERIEVEGIFTHLSAADSRQESDVSFTKTQIDLICAIKKELNKRLVYIKYMHFLNSAGASYHFDARSDFARFGIMLYGLHPDINNELPVPLEPVMELKACVSQVKTVEAGVPVSYGRTFVTERETKVASVTIGYADGYPRLLSGKAEVLVHGKRAKILGRVCMDQLMIDVSHIEGVKPGDCVTLIGRDGGEEITADELAASYGSIGYELVCGISPRVPRRVITENP